MACYQNLLLYPNQARPNHSYGTNNGGAQLLYQSRMNINETRFQPNGLNKMFRQTLFQRADSLGRLQQQQQQSQSDCRMYKVEWLICILAYPNAGFGWSLGFFYLEAMEKQFCFPIQTAC